MKKLEIVLEVLFFLTVLYLTFQSFVTSDFYFHIKTGEYILTTGSIPFKDVFSSSVYGKPIIPYEWLFEVLTYLIYHNFGFFGVSILASFFLLSYLIIYRQILVEIFKINLPLRIFFMSLTVYISYPFWSERPQIAAFTLFLATIYLILKRVFLGKNLLWITIPLFWIWTNLHASMVLGLALFASFGLFFGLKYLKQRDKSDLKVARDVGVIGTANLLITIFPPLGTSVYELLFKFYQNRELITSFIDEWAPLSANRTYVLIFATLYVLAFGSFLFVLFKSKKSQYLALISLLPLSLLVITGLRHAAFSLPLILLFFVPIINFSKWKVKKIIPIMECLGIIIAFGLALNHYVQFSQDSYQQEERYYPAKAIPFIKQNLKGNMFTDIKLGGYFLNAIGPEQKLVIDGRTEMYLPEVMTDFQELSNHKYEPEDQFLKYFNNFINKYDVSWVFILSENFTVWRKIMHILYYQPNWYLVYFDDTGIIMVRDDGKNQDVIKKYALSAATPFQKSIYREGSEEQALKEYQKMDNLISSSVTQNSLGYFLFKQKKIEESKPYFIKAVELDPLAPTPKVNLAEVYAYEGQEEQAIPLYEHVIKEDPGRSTAYLRLGQLYVKTGRPRDEAVSLWQTALTTEFLDEATKQKLQDLITGP